MRGDGKENNDVEKVSVVIGIRYDRSGEQRAAEN
jgi:hypothetical protein